MKNLIEYEYSKRIIKICLACIVTLITMFMLATGCTAQEETFYPEDGNEFAFESEIKILDTGDLITWVSTSTLTKDLVELNATFVKVVCTVPSDSPEFAVVVRKGGLKYTTFYLRDHKDCPKVFLPQKLTFYPEKRGYFVFDSSVIMSESGIQEIELVTHDQNGIKVSLNIANVMVFCEIQPNMPEYAEVEIRDKVPFTTFYLHDSRDCRNITAPYEPQTGPSGSDI